MKRYALIGASLALAAIMSLSSCGTIDKLEAGYTVATSASISRNDAMLAIASTKTLEDLATSYTDSCIASKSYTGVCAPTAVEAIHKAIVATRQPRKNLAAFAQAHAGAELGASGLYDALISARDSLSSVLKQYGYSVPST